MTFESSLIERDRAERLRLGNSMYFFGANMHCWQWKKRRWEKKQGTIRSWFHVRVGWVVLRCQMTSGGFLMKRAWAGRLEMPFISMETKETKRKMREQVCLSKRYLKKIVAKKWPDEWLMVCYGFHPSGLRFTDSNLRTKAQERYTFPGLLSAQKNLFIKIHTRHFLKSFLS